MEALASFNLSASCARCDAWAQFDQALNARQLARLQAEAGRSGVRLLRTGPLEFEVSCAVCAGVPRRVTRRLLVPVADERVCAGVL